jgi:hypothetical protein
MRPECLHASGPPGASGGPRPRADRRWRSGSGRPGAAAPVGHGELLGRVFDECPLSARHLWVLVPGWVLEIHYTAWTGRHGRRVAFTRPSPLRIAVVRLTAAGVVAAGLLR